MMSEWYKPKAEDIELSDDGKTIEIYVHTNDFGNVYADVPIELLRPYFIPPEPCDGIPVTGCTCGMKPCQCPF